MYKLVGIQYEKMQFVYEGEEQDFDRYNVEIRRPISTHEYSVVVNHKTKSLSGDVIRYGSWDDLEPEEIIGILEIVEAEGQLRRPFREHI